MSETSIKIEDFSEHLFWDVDKSKLDLEKSKKYIINRVLQYGLYHDWQIIYNYYGITKIGEVATRIRDLDKKTSSFIALLTNIPKEQFLCYTIAQSHPKHWNF